MYTSNALAKIVEKLEENLHEVHNMIESDHDDAETRLRDTFEHLYQSCGNFSLLCTTPNTGQHIIKGLKKAGIELPSF